MNEKFKKLQHNQLSTKNSTLNSTCESSVTTEDITQLTVRSVHLVEASNAKSHNQDDTKSKNVTASSNSSMSQLPETSSSPLIAPSTNNNNNTSLIIIDTDELNTNNETQIIQKIIDEYERRLQEQLALAREDIVHELEQQIQVSGKFCELHFRILCFVYMSKPLLLRFFLCFAKFEVSIFFYNFLLHLSA